MSFDAIAAGLAAKRYHDTREFLEMKLQPGEVGDVQRNRWVQQQNHPEKQEVAEQEHRYAAWAKHAVPSWDEMETLLVTLPKGAWAIHFTFTLATPYMSKGIEAFDLLDNPIVRDKVYEVPIVPASSWKGGLHAAAAMHVFESIDAYIQAVKHAHKLQEDQQAQWDTRLRQLVRIFGVEKEIEHDYSAGRLHCFPTGFKRTRCEVINPHNRARRVGSQPILLETVPEGESGTFTALYVPFGNAQDGEAAADLTICAAAIRALLLEWGIGAKKSNGNGLATSTFLESLTRQHDVMMAHIQKG